MDDRYRVNREGTPRYVEHRDDSERGWCGPLIPSAEHSRAGELPEPVICICCGDFCEGVDVATVATVERLTAKMDREDRADDARQAALDKLRRAGVDVTKLPASKARSRGRRAEQQALPWEKP